MVGLSIVLESQQRSSNYSCTNTNSSNGCCSNYIKNPQVINKITMIKPPASNPFFLAPPPLTPFTTTAIRTTNVQGRSSLVFPVNSFLDACCFCSQRLLPGKDIYMYKGDRAFCSEECRLKHIFMDEEENYTVQKRRTSSERNKTNCSMEANNNSNKRIPPTTLYTSPTFSPSKSVDYRHYQHRRKNHRGDCTKTVTVDATKNPVNGFAY